MTGTAPHGTAPHDLDAETIDTSPVVARGLVKSFLSPDGSRVAAVDGVDFVAPHGQITAIIGQSGSGKTTLLQRLGIAHRLDHTPEQLSGGQKQRVAVARALFAEPAIVFADEPTGALDAESAERLLDVIREAVDELGQTVVLVTHDLAVAELAHEVHVLHAGKLTRQR
jgi:ABC-type lipoprotein export system ATPase subunit